MEKHKTISDFVETLKKTIDFSGIELTDHWQADLCAIGISKNNKMVYISTYNYVDIQPVKYDYDLELTNDAYTVLKAGRNVSEIELMNEIKIFLEI